MRTLVIETATSACSVALIEDGAVLAARHEVVGRGHAERLVPMIAELPEGGRADRLVVDCGPGSFTGVRVGLAAAIGLGIGWGVEVGGFSSLAALAAAGFARAPLRDELAVVLEGGHGEVFVQRFRREPFSAMQPLASLRPEAAIEALGGVPAVGNGVRFLTALNPMLTVEEAMPSAVDVVLLPPALAALPAKPIYGRPPDAKPMAVRG